MVFTDEECAHLAGHRLGRLATIGPDGAPQVHPVATWPDEEAGTIDVSGRAPSQSQKFRNIQADPRVSLVVDDQAETPNPLGQTGRGIEIRGRAEIVPLTRRSRGVRQRDDPRPPAPGHPGTSASSSRRPDGCRTFRATAPATYPGKGQSRRQRQIRARVSRRPDQLDRIPPDPLNPWCCS